MLGSLLLGTGLSLWLLDGRLLPRGILTVRWCCGMDSECPLKCLVPCLTLLGVMEALMGGAWREDGGPWMHALAGIFGNLLSSAVFL